MGGCRFGYTEDGLPGYKKEGADTVYPFNGINKITTPFTFESNFADVQTRYEIDAPDGKCIDTVSFMVEQPGTYKSGANFVLQLSDGSYLHRFESSSNWPVANYTYEYTAEVPSTHVLLIINRTTEQSSPSTIKGTMTVTFKNSV